MTGNSPRVVLAAILLAVGVAVFLVTANASPTDETVQQSQREARTLVNSWVERSGSSLTLDGKPWRFSGVNMYWLGLDDNVLGSGGPTYPTHEAIDSGFRAAAALGARVVRSTSLGVSVGAPRSIEPSRGAFNDKAFASIDYAVAAARRAGIRLMIPLTDQGHYYSGGKHTFTNWDGHSDIPGDTIATTEQRQRESLFYTDAGVIADFHAYVKHVLEHRNPLTGLRLGADPTIAIWETGNELYDAPPAWTEQTAAFIKSLAPRALIADGAAASGKQISETGYAQHDVDIEDGHFYPTDPAKARHDAAVVAAAHKVYVVGEYPINGSKAAPWLSGLAADTHHIAGDLAWSLLPRPHGKPEPHHDGYTFHYPGATSAESSQDRMLEAHARQMDGP